MQEIIADSLSRVVEGLYAKGILSEELNDKDKNKSAKRQNILVNLVPPNIAGDYSTNMILTHSKQAKLPPADLAAIVIEEISQEPWCDQAEFVKPGFINIYCSQSNQVIGDILQQGDKYGADLVKNKPQASDSTQQTSKKILIEYVSANPTGPLHTGHGRAAALGSALGKILNFIGHKVDTEFYLNDAGRQMNILTTTFIWRLLQNKNISDASLLDNMYQGDYVTQMVPAWLSDKDGLLTTKITDDKLQDISSKWQGVIASPADADDMEKQVDALIAIAQQELGEDYAKIKQWVLHSMVTQVKQDLADFGTEFTHWFYESSCSESGADMRMLERLKQRGHAYEKEGALWFSSSKFGDDKDRVLIRNNGDLTYFGSDISYHHDKYERGYDIIIDILGADHHGYVNRIISSMDALGHDPQKMKVLLLQLVFLIGKDTDDGKSSRLSMSTRKGKFQELSDLVKQVGVDATRFFYLMYKSDREINFDVDLAVSQSKENPVYYVQYAHARICRIFDELDKSNLGSWQDLQKQGLKSLNNLTEAKEKDIILKLSQFVPVLQNIGTNYEVHVLINYLRELAGDFHSYYNSVRILEEGNDAPARLCLCDAVRTIIHTGLSLIGVSAPDKM